MVGGWFLSELHLNVDGNIFVGMVVDVGAGYTLYSYFPLPNPGTFFSISQTTSILSQGENGNKEGIGRICRLIP